jgi:hypothetical protein
METVLQHSRFIEQLTTRPIYYLVARVFIKENKKEPLIITTINRVIRTNFWKGLLILEIIIATERA